VVQKAVIWRHRVRTGRRRTDGLGHMLDGLVRGPGSESPGRPSFMRFMDDGPAPVDCASRLEPPASARASRNSTSSPMAGGLLMLGGGDDPLSLQYPPRPGSARASALSRAPGGCSGAGKRARVDQVRADACGRRGTRPPRHLARPRRDHLSSGRAKEGCRRGYLPAGGDRGPSRVGMNSLQRLRLHAGGTNSDGFPAQTGQFGNRLART